MKRDAKAEAATAQAGRKLENTPAYKQAYQQAQAGGMNETNSHEFALDIASRYSYEAAPAKSGQHTPGPWKKRCYRSQYGAVGYWNTTPFEVAQDCPEQIAQANARLIAAAPELLEALRGLMEYWDNGTAVQPGAEIVTEARTILAKIGGKQ